MSKQSQCDLDNAVEIERMLDVALQQTQFGQIFVDYDEDRYGFSFVDHSYPSPIPDAMVDAAVEEFTPRVIALIQKGFEAKGFHSKPIELTEDTEPPAFAMVMGWEMLDAYVTDQIGFQSVAPDMTYYYVPLPPIAFIVVKEEWEMGVLPLAM